jgi:hypothetical protein
MKRLLSSFFTLFIFLLVIYGSYAGNSINPPSPNPTGKKPPPPKGLSIDEDVFILFIIAILLGIYIIYKNNLKAKNPI